MLRFQVPSNHNQVTFSKPPTIVSDDLVDALKEKLREELKELDQAETKEEKLSELDDLQAILDALRIVLTDSDEPHAFSLGQYVETITLDEKDSWVEYFRAEPDRFKEIS